MTVVDDVKAQIDLVDIVSQTVKLRKTGKNYTGFCPFHSNTRTPAFVVFPDSQSWRCFGQCNEGGDVFGYLMKRESWDFPETLRYLAEKAGITLKPLTPEKEISDNALEAQRRLLEETVAFYQKQLIDTPAGKQALDYLRRRGLTDETIKVWELGYAPAGWTDLMNAMARKGYSTAAMLEAGLASERDDNSSYDKFRNRLMFPIRDAYGKMCGFGGRVLNPDDVPKYMNSPRTDLFDKGRLLYGMHMARQNIRAKEQAVLVEGYMDVIGLHQAGYGNAISAMGTALTEDQFNLLKRFSHNIVLALDPDAAGEKATLRGLETARRTMDQDAELSFDAKGLLRVESRLNADIRVTTLPDGRDPDEIVLEDPEKWQEILANAKPVVLHVMQTLAAEQDLNDPKVKSEVAGQILPLIADVSNAVEREAYRQQLADLLRVDVRALGEPEPPTVSRRRRASQANVPPSAEVFKTPAQRNRNLERYAIQALTEDPEALYKINKTLGMMNILQLSEKDFHEGDMSMAYQIIITSLQQDEVSAEEFLKENMPDLLEPEPERNGTETTREPSANRKLEDQVRNILRMRKNMVEDRILEIRYLREQLDEPLYSQEEAEFLLIEQLNMRRMLDIAMEKVDGGLTALNATGTPPNTPRNRKTR